MTEPVRERSPHELTDSHSGKVDYCMNHAWLRGKKTALASLSLSTIEPMVLLNASKE